MTLSCSFRACLDKTRKMELSNLEESLSGPIPSSFYRTIALAEENDVELGVKLRMAESNLVTELKKLRENQRVLSETNQVLLKKNFVIFKNFLN